MKALIRDVLARHTWDGMMTSRIDDVCDDIVHAVGLTFAELRAANIARRDELLRVKMPNFRPENEWSLNDWMTALTGEIGEIANLLKKVKRGDFTLDEARLDIATEIADAQTYLDLLAHRADIDLAAATIMKWNEVSRRVGLPHRIGGRDVQL